MRSDLRTTGIERPGFLAGAAAAHRQKGHSSRAAGTPRRLPRLSRRRRIVRWAFNLIHDVREAGGRIEFVTETHLNVDGPAADLMLANMATMAREESKSKSDRVRIGLDAARANGGAVTRAPWGVPDHGGEAGEAVRPDRAGPQARAGSLRAHRGRRVADRRSAVAEGERDRQRLRAHGRDDDPQPRLQRVVVSAGGVITHRVAEPLVDAALWKRANGALDSDTRRRRGPNQVKALLAGVAKCGECGAAMYRAPAERRRPPIIVRYRSVIFE